MIPRPQEVRHQLVEALNRDDVEVAPDGPGEVVDERVELPFVERLRGAAVSRAPVDATPVRPRLLGAVDQEVLHDRRLGAAVPDNNEGAVSEKRDQKRDEAISEVLDLLDAVLVGVVVDAPVQEHELGVLARGRETGVVARDANGVDVVRPPDDLRRLGYEIVEVGGEHRVDRAAVHEFDETEVPLAWWHVRSEHPFTEELSPLLAGPEQVLDDLGVVRADVPLLEPGVVGEPPVPVAPLDAGIVRVHVVGERVRPAPGLLHDLRRERDAGTDRSACAQQHNGSGDLS